MRDIIKKAFVMVLTGAALLLTALFATGTSAQAAGTASVSVVHGIPNTPVNVFVNGKSTLADFKPGTVAGPLSLPAGTYKVTVFAASNTKGTGTPVISANATVAAGKNDSLVAHLTADGEPTITPYVNDTSPVAAVRPASSSGTTRRTSGRRPCERRRRVRGSDQPEPGPGRPGRGFDQG